MNATKTVERRKGGRRSHRLCDFLLELYEDVLPDSTCPEESPKSTAHTQISHVLERSSDFDWGHFFPTNASGKTLVRMIKSRALFLE